MNTRISSPWKNAGVRWFHFWLPMLALLLGGTARGAPQDIDMNCVAAPTPHPFNARVGTLFDQPIGTQNNPGAKVFWEFVTNPVGCGATPPFNCNGVQIALPAGAPDSSVPNTEKVQVHGTPTAPGTFAFRLVATLDSGGGTSCERDYTLDIKPLLSITPAGAIVFGKSPGDHKKVIAITNNDTIAIGEIDFTITCTNPLCYFNIADKLVNLGPGTSQDREVTFQGPLWMTDYLATLVVTVPNSSYRFEIALQGNKGKPVITRQPDQLELSSPHNLQGSVVLGNQESEKLTGIGIRIADCVGGDSCPFSVTPNALELEPKGDVSQQDSKAVSVELVENTCGTANLEVTVPGSASSVAAVRLKGLSEGAKVCSQDRKSVRECRNGQWQTTQRCARDFCFGGECICTQDGTACATITARSVCSNGTRVEEKCSANQLCANNVCQTLPEPPVLHPRFFWR